jgi:hypothetical protein
METLGERKRYSWVAPEPVWKLRLEGKSFVTAGD